MDGWLVQSRRSRIDFRSRHPRSPYPREKNQVRMTMGRRMAAIFVFAGLLPVASVAAPLLSEVFYDATGSDNGYFHNELRFEFLAERTARIP